MKQRKPMARGKPLERKPFKRSQPVREERPERIAPVVKPLERVPSYWKAANDPVVAAPKRVYVRCKALTNACRELPCQHCGRAVPGTVCAAHSNWSDWGGKGARIKADDSCVAALCDLCHVPVLDQGSKLSYDERRAMWLAAHRATVRELQARGLWPAGVPVPILT